MKVKESHMVKRKLVPPSLNGSASLEARVLEAEAA